MGWQKLLLIKINANLHMKLKTCIYLGKGKNTIFPTQGCPTFEITEDPTVANRWNEWLDGPLDFALYKWAN